MEQHHELNNLIIKEETLSEDSKPTSTSHTTSRSYNDLKDLEPTTEPLGVTKTIHKAHFKKKRYKNITDDTRQKLIDSIENKGEKIKHAAKKLNVNYSTAKSIIQVFKKEGRAGKKNFKKRLQKEGEQTPIKYQALPEISIPHKFASTTTDSYHNISMPSEVKNEAENDSLQYLRDQFSMSRFKFLRHPNDFLSSGNPLTAPSCSQDLKSTLSPSDLTNSTKIEEASPLKTGIPDTDPLKELQVKTSYFNSLHALPNFAALNANTAALASTSMLNRVGNFYQQPNLQNLPLQNSYQSMLKQMTPANIYSGLNHLSQFGLQSLGAGIDVNSLSKLQFPAMQLQDQYTANSGLLNCQQFMSYPHMQSAAANYYPQLQSVTPSQAFHSGFRL